MATSAPTSVTETRSHGGRVATVTLSRPRVRNAINMEMRIELASVFDRLADDAELHAVVVTGAGPTFSVGGDLAELDSVGGRGEIRERIHAGNEMIRALRRIAVPTIAAVQGSAAGAGCALALACDVVVVSDDASLHLAFLDVGLGPDAGASQLVVRRVGTGRALDIALWGYSVPAGRAFEFNLVDHVLPSEQYAVELAALLDRIADLSGPALRATTDLYRSADTLEGAMAAELEHQVDLVLSPEHRAARTRFLERRAHARTSRRHP